MDFRSCKETLIHMKKEDRPILDIPNETIDWILLGIGSVALLLMFGLPAYYYHSLPDQIPIHFGPNGKPDSYTGKIMIWLLPAIGAIVYFGLLIINRFPHTFNYLTPITEENAYRQYRIATRMIYALIAMITSIFAYITHVIIQTALGEKSGLGTYFTPIFLVLFFGVLGYFIYQSISDAKSS